MQNFYKECVGNTNIQLNNILEVNLQTPLEILYHFCNFYEVDISLAEYHLEKGTFKKMYNKKYYDTPIYFGKYIAEHVLEKVLDRLDIKAYEFC